MRKVTHLLLGAHPDRHPENLARGIEVLLSHFKLGKLDPDFGKRKLLVRDEFQARAVDLARSLEVLRSGFW